MRRKAQFLGKADKFEPNVAVNGYAELQIADADKDQLSRQFRLLLPLEG